MDGNLLSALLGRTHATCMQATPGMWRLLLDAGWQGGSDFKALIGGEALPPDLAEAFARSHGRTLEHVRPDRDDCLVDRVAR